MGARIKKCLEGKKIKKGKGKWIKCLFWRDCVLPKDRVRGSAVYTKDLERVLDQEITAWAAEILTCSGGG